MFYDAHAPALLETRDHVIPPDAEFQLSYRLPTYDKEKSPQRVPVEEFLANYGGITFVFDYNGNQTFKHEFRYPALRDYLLSRQRDHEQSRKQPPGVRKISE